MKHALQVKLACRWLKKNVGCAVVLAEPGGRFDPEHPDAIGWRLDGYCYVVECKATRKDFLEDWRPDRKDFRRNNSGLGHFRYYMANPGIVSPSELDEKGWGLLETLPKNINLLRSSAIFDTNRDAEMRLILSSIANGKHEKKARQLPLGFPSRW